MQMPEADFMWSFKKFLDNHVDIRFQELERDHEQTIEDHEDPKTDLEVKVDDIDVKCEEFEDRLDSLDCDIMAVADYDTRIEDLETAISEQQDKIDELEKEISRTVSRRISELAARGQLRIYVEGQSF